MYFVGEPRRLCTVRGHNGLRTHTLTSDCPILFVSFCFLLCWNNISTGIFFFVCVYIMYNELSPSLGKINVVL